MDGGGQQLGFFILFLFLTQWARRRLRSGNAWPKKQIGILELNAEGPEEDEGLPRLREQER